MAQDNNNAELQRLSDLTKIPTFTGNKSADLFNAENWIAHIERPKLTGNWNNDLTMAYVLNALHDEALMWNKSCTHTNTSVTVWNEWKLGFLESYSVDRTARTATVNLANLMQGQSEHDTSF